MFFIYFFVLPWKKVDLFCSKGIFVVVVHSLTLSLYFINTHSGPTVFSLLQFHRRRYPKKPFPFLLKYIPLSPTQSNPQFPEIILKIPSHSQKESPSPIFLRYTQIELPFFFFTTVCVVFVSDSTSLVFLTLSDDVRNTIPCSPFFLFRRCPHHGGGIDGMARRRSLDVEFGPR